MSVEKPKEQTLKRPFIFLAVTIILGIYLGTINWGSFIDFINFLNAWLYNIFMI